MRKGSFFSTRLYRDHIDKYVSELGYSELVQRLFTFFPPDPLILCDWTTLLKLEKTIMIDVYELVEGTAC